MVYACSPVLGKLSSFMGSLESWPAEMGGLRLETADEKMEMVAITTGICVVAVFDEEDRDNMREALS